MSKVLGASKYAHTSLMADIIAFVRQTAVPISQVGVDAAADLAARCLAARRSRLMERHDRRFIVGPLWVLERP